MAGTASVNSGVLLLEQYDRKGAMLYESMRAAGFGGPVLVLHDEGFLPQDVFSLYRYFCQEKDGKGKSGRPRFFNEVERPDYWEITANNTSGRIMDKGQEKALIRYADAGISRHVSRVDWRDRSGVIRFSDHYDSRGVLYARTVSDKQGAAVTKSFFDREGREVLVRNFRTGDIVLNRRDKVRIFRDEADLVLAVLEDLDAAGRRLFYNSLSTPFFVSHRMGSAGPCDVLFWQEPPRADIPGNMRYIFDHPDQRTREICVQDRASYERLLGLGAPEQYLQLLGYIYPFKPGKNRQNEALICTNSDQVLHLETLVRALPELTFHVAAVTEMSQKILQMAKYPNVRLYPGISVRKAEKLFERCRYYLDINYGDEILDAAEQAFLNRELIMGFADTLHRADRIAEELVFHDAEGMAAALKKAIKNEKTRERWMSGQEKAAMTEKAETYRKILGL